MQHPKSDEKILSADSLTIGYGDRMIASGISLSLYAGGVTALLGGNGIGKSTLLRTLTGELPPLAGGVRLCGRPLADYSRRQLASLVSVVTTDRVSAGGLRVRELVELGRHPHTGFFGRLGRSDRDAVESAMHSVGIAYKADSFLSELSDGERQKAMIARALAQETPLIVLDEPFSFLDVAARIHVFSLLQCIAAERGMAVLLSSHDVSQALRMADSVLLFTTDRRLLAGSPAELMADGSIDLMFPGSDVAFDPGQLDFVAR